MRKAASSLKTKGILSGLKLLISTSLEIKDSKSLSSAKGPSSGLLMRFLISLANSSVICGSMDFKTSVLAAFTLMALIP